MSGYKKLGRDEVADIMDGLTPGHYVIVTVGRGLIAKEIIHQCGAKSFKYNVAFWDRKFIVRLIPQLNIAVIGELV